MEEEQLILVDGADRPVGVGGKTQVHREGWLHRAFSVFIFDSGGRVLLQQRAATKYHCASLWSNTCCSHPRPGEPTAAAARRRLTEEMGLECELEEAFSFVYKARLGARLYEHEYDHVFLGRFDGTPEPDPEEVADWRWVPVEELAAELESNPALYTPWLKLSVGGVVRHLGRPFPPPRKWERDEG